MGRKEIKMTEKQRALLENIPKCDNNIYKAAKMSGYSEYTARSSIYNLMRNSKKIERKSEDAVKEKYLKETRKLKKKFLKAGDYTNTARMHEAIGKVEGLFKETINTNQGGNIVIIDKQGLLNNTQPIDNTQVKENIPS